MNIPILKKISLTEFESSEEIYKIISHDSNNNYCYYFEFNNQKYYIGYFSPGITTELKILGKENYLLVGVDLKVAVICLKTGRILFLLGLFSLFKQFEDTNDLYFTIFSELEDIVVNKNGLSISKIIPHDLLF